MATKKAKPENESLLDDYQAFVKELDENTELPKEVKEKMKKGKKLQDYLSKKKKAFKNTKYRKKYDNMLRYIDENLVNTETYKTAYQSETSGVAYSYVYNNGAYTQIPMLGRGSEEIDNRIPLAKEPIAFAKITTAVSVLTGKAPDATVISANKIYSRTMYELWKRTWTNPLSNSMDTLQFHNQNVLTTGFGAYRVFPKKVQNMHKGVPRIMYDDIYRQALDPKRTWVGNSVNIYDRWSKGEVLYEIDQDAEIFLGKYDDAKYFQLEFANTVEESEVDPTQGQNFVVIKYYENPITNKYCVACGNYPIYEGELPNEEGFGHVIWANCFINNPNDPYGVGLVELMRGNTELYDYITRLNAEQVEAEISPLLFATNTGAGEMTYRRGPNVVNAKVQGTTIDSIKTNGNVQQSIMYADKQKQIISDNTGINDTLAGTAGEGTLGATVIMKEAALNRLIIPRNSIASGLETDAYITVSWIKQTYTVEKVQEFNTVEEIQQFIANNPNYFVRDITEETEEMYEEDPMNTSAPEHEEYATKKSKGKRQVAVSKRVPLNFDIVSDEEFPDDPEKDTIEEKSDDFTIPTSELFKAMQDRGHISDRIQFIIDPSSTILPSEEINKQRITQIYQMVQPATAQIMQALPVMPDLARTLMKQLEHILEINKESIFDWVPKDIFDKVMQPAPQQQLPMPTEVSQGQMEGGPMGLTGAMGQPGMNAPSAMGPMTQEFNKNMGGPSNPLNDALNASMGRGANELG